MIETWKHKVIRESLEKGYSITTFEGKALKDAREVAKGDIIETKLQEGTILSKVTKIIEMDIN